MIVGDQDDVAPGVLVVLAGGRSSRFGADKALAPFAGTPEERSEPLALRTLRRLARLAPRRLLVRAAPLAGVPADVVRIADPRPGEGPLQALAAAFAALPARRWFVAPCDLPWLEAAIYERMQVSLERTPGAAVAVARAPDGLEPLVSIWTPAAATPLAGWLADEPQLAVHAALARFDRSSPRGPALLEVEFDDPRLFLNVNTREDLEQARAAPPARPLATGVAGARS